MTNVAAINAGEFKDPAEFKKFFSEKTAPTIYLISRSEKTKSDFTSLGGPSYETRVYSLEAGFYLDDNEINQQVFKFELEGFSKEIELNMSHVNRGASPETLGNAAIIDNVMVLANVNRQGDVLEVLLSSVAPKDYKNIRFYLFDHENQLFKNGVHIVDKDGNMYMPDDEIRKQNNSNIDTLYFNIPQNREGLKLVVPQILYSRTYSESNIKIAMPKLGKEEKISKELNLPGSTVLIEKASIVPSGDPILPEEFKKYDCLRIDASSKSGDNGREMVNRVIPRVELPDNFFKSRYIGTSQSTNSELWDIEQRGYSLTEFQTMDTAKKIYLKFDVEYAMTGPWKIEIH